MKKRVIKINDNNSGRVIIDNIVCYYVAMKKEADSKLVIQFSFANQNSLIAEEYFYDSFELVKKDAKKLDAYFDLSTPEETYTLDGI